MKTKHIRALLNYLLIDDSVTLKEEKIMGFPTSPKAVEKLIGLAFAELNDLELKLKELEE